MCLNLTTADPPARAGQTFTSVGQGKQLFTKHRRAKRQNRPPATKLWRWKLIVTRVTDSLNDAEEADHRVFAPEGLYAIPVNPIRRRRLWVVVTVPGRAAACGRVSVGAADSGVAHGLR